MTTDSARTLWEMLASRQIALYLDDGKLKTRAAPGSITDEIASLIRTNRDALVALLSMGEGASQAGAPRIPRASGMGEAPATTGQRRLWLSQKRAGASAIYNVPLAVELRGSLDVAALEGALHAVVARHDALRTRFVEEGGEIVARLHDEPFVLGRHEAAGTEVPALVRALSARSFDVSVDALFRADLVRTNADEHVLVLCMHHIVADGWSCGILIKELEIVYNAAVEGATASLPDLPLQFGDYAHWLAAQAQRDREDANLEYWREQLRDVPAVHALPLDRPRPRVQSYDGAVAEHLLPANIADDLRRFAGMEGTTVYCVLQAVLALLVARWSNERDVVIGTSTSGRSHPELEGLVGFFINPLILRNRIEDTATVSEYIARSQSLLLGAMEHQQIAFERVTDEVLPSRSTSHAPIFQLMFDYRRDAGPSVALSGLSCRALPLSGEGAKYDIEVTATDSNAGIHLRWVYATHLFEAATIGRLQRSFGTLLAACLASPDRRLDALAFLPEEEAAFILNAGQGMRTAHSPGTLVDRFERMARQHPDAVAVEYDDQTLTYEALDIRSNRLSHFLRKLGLVAGKRVAIYLDPGPEWLVAILATLKAGGTYVPLDTAYPEERVEYVLEDAGVDIVLCSQDVMDESAFVDRRVVPVDMAVQDALFASQPEEAPVLAPDEHPAAAYVLYTSGSTGRPKGVVVGHEALAQYLDHAATYFTEGTRGAVVSTSIGFDATVTSLLAPLVTGKRVALLESGLDALFAGLDRYLFDDGHAWLFKVTPSHMTALSHVCAGRAVASTGHVFVIGGEQLDHALINQWRTRWLPAASYINEYGPTEATVGCSIHVIGADDTQVPTSGAVSIGKPIANACMYALMAGQPVPVGAVGELHIGGAGLADGYMNLPETTAERFVTLSGFGATERFYRTGDLVRLLADGRFEFVKRIDDQWKVRGYRIELGEIESVLRSIQGVREAAVNVQDDATQRVLVAFVQPEDAAVDRAVFQQKVRQEASRVLPEYMLPSLIEVIGTLPLTINGKVDRQALPSVDIAASLGLRHVAPSTDLEAMLCGLWQDATGMERVGTQDNFLEIGGNSLMFVKLRGDIEHRLGRKLDITAFFEYPTIADLALHLQAVDVPDAESDEVDGDRTVAEPRAAIAVVSMAGRFPDAGDTDEFWTNLLEGKESLRTFTLDELVAGGFGAEVASHPDFVASAAIVDGVKDFDADYFRMTPREAEVLDPQQRLLFECTVTALERAGYGNFDQSQRCGVFVGCGESSYLAQNLLPKTDLLRNLGLAVLHANSTHYVATRLAYKLNLTGPAVNVATACSTSLVAVHQAVNSLRMGECDIAVAGGAGVSEFDVGGYLYQEGGIESPDGHCRAFDADARGTRGGNGAGIVVLRRLEDALRDGDTIHAVIRGSAINNDGAQKVGYTAPSVGGQAEVIASALRDADLRPAQIQYVETHGTGTPLGDPVEFRALSRVFQAAPTQGCVLGTLKPNIGHLDAAAGIAGLIKTIHVVRDGVIPPSIRFERPNPSIELAGSPFHIHREASAWTTQDDAPRRAGVSAFGIGGTNAHVIVEQAPGLDDGTVEPDNHYRLLPLSARSETALSAQVGDLLGYIDGGMPRPLADIAFTLQLGRKKQAWRTFAVADSHDGLRMALRETARQTFHDHADARRRPAVVLMFPGQGAQYAGMALGLLGNAPRFTEVLERCRVLVKEYAGFDIVDVLRIQDDGDSLLATRLAQPVLFAVEYALAMQLMDTGIQPAAMVGHSLGEIVAACVAGVFDLELALRFVCERARCMHAAPSGAMLAIGATRDVLDALPLPDGVVVAAVNGPQNLVCAGDSAVIDALESTLAAADVACRRLHTSHAFHSPSMGEAAAEVRKLLEGVSLKEPTIPFASNVTGRLMTSAQACDSAYWADHILSTVRFADGLAAVCDALRHDDREPVFVEVGPGGSLATLVRRHPDAASMQVVPVMRRPQESEHDAARWLEAVGTLWSLGCDIDWHRLPGAGKGRRVPLPGSRFERKRYWVERSPGSGKDASPASTSSARSGGFYVPTWELAPRAAVSSDKGVVAAPWWILTEGEGVAGHLQARLRDDGIEARNVSRQEVHDGFAGIVDELGDEQVLSIACLWSLDAHDDVGTSTSGDFHVAQRRTLYPLRALMARLAECKPRLQVRLIVVTDRIFRVTGAEALRFADAAVRGLCKVAPQENPLTTCRLIDVDASDVDHGAAVEALAARIHREIAHGGDIPEVALRGNSRWLKRYVSLPQSPLAVARPRWVRGGHYVITGGLGRMGMHIAAWLCGEHGARVTLLGRRDFPPSSEWMRGDPRLSVVTAAQVDRLLSLREHGARIEVIQADVADRDSVHSAVVEAERRQGSIDGIFHAAGNVADSLVPLQETEEDVFTGQFASKIDGVVHLQEIMDAHGIGLCVVMSSLAAELGGLGFTAYAAASAGMDAFVQQRRNEGDERWCSIDWDGWNFSGDAGARHGMEHAMTPEDGIRALSVAMAYADQPLLVHSVTDIDARFARWVGMTDRTPAAAKAKDERRSSSKEFVLPETPSEVIVTGIWEAMLGLDDIGTSDNFFEIGGDSLVATRLVARIRAQFDINDAVFSLADFFANPTIFHIANRIDRHAVAVRLSDRQSQLRQAETVEEGEF